MLWNEPCSIDDPEIDRISQFLSKNSKDHFERVPLIVALEILDIFEEKSLRPLRGDNSRHIKKEGSLGSTFESVRPSKRVLLTHPGDRKGLAWKSCEQNVVVRDFIHVLTCDVAD